MADTGKFKKFSKRNKTAACAVPITPRIHKLNQNLLVNVIIQDIKNGQFWKFETLGPA